MQMLNIITLCITRLLITSLKKIINMARTHEAAKDRDYYEAVHFSHHIYVFERILPNKHLTL